MKLIYSRLAEKEILKLDRLLGQRIFQKIDLLKDDPYGLDSQKLEGGKGYRIKIGDYRVIYTVDKVNKIVNVVKIAHRREVYK